MGAKRPVPDGAAGRAPTKRQSTKAAPVVKGAHAPGAPATADLQHPTLQYLRGGLQTDAAKEFLATAGDPMDVAGIPAFDEDLYTQSMEKWGANGRTYHN